MLHSGVNIPNHDLVQSSEISIVKCNTLFNSCNNYLYRYEHDSILLKKKGKPCELCVRAAPFLTESHITLQDR